jgi:RNA polymerase sigma factor (sigma-70 family)
MTMSPDLGELAKRLASDRDDAFPDFVRALHGPVFSGALRLTGSHHDAEEVTQDAFVRAYNALDKYPASQVRQLRLRPWLWTIALNLCRNRARSHARRPAQSSLERHAEPVDSTSTEATALDAADDTWQRRLAALPEAMRTAVVLKHVVGLSYDEIALALGRPAGTVKSDVHRGIDRLRTALTSEGVFV